MAQIEVMLMNEEGELLDSFVVIDDENEPDGLAQEVRNTIERHHEVED